MLTRIKFTIALLMLLFAGAGVTLAQVEGPSVLNNPNPIYTNNSSKVQRIMDVIHKNVPLNGMQYNNVYKIVSGNIENSSKPVWGHFKQSLKDELSKNQLKQVQGLKSDIVSIWGESDPTTKYNDDDKKDKEWKDKDDDTRKNGGRKDADDTKSNNGNTDKKDKGIEKDKKEKNDKAGKKENKGKKIKDHSSDAG